MWLYKYKEYIAAENTRIKSWGIKYKENGTIEIILFISPNKFKEGGAAILKTHNKNIHTAKEGVTD